MKLSPAVITVIVVSTCVLLLAWYLWTPDKDRSTLERQYIRSPTDLIEVAGVRLHVRDNGPKDAPAVIFLHGFGASLHTWEPWASELQSSLRVVRFDLPGSGLSSTDPSGDYSDTRSLQIITTLMDKLEIAEASFVGNSIGGRIAWTFAAAHPERVHKLVLVSPDGFASPGFNYGKKPEVPATVKLMRYTLPKPLLRMSLKPAYADPSLLTDQLVSQYHDLMLAPGSRNAMISRMEQTVLTDPVPLLKRITAPTLLLWGEKDAMIPLANSAEYLKSIASSRLIALSGLGHLPQEEAPMQSVRPVRAFLTGTP